MKLWRQAKAEGPAGRTTEFVPVSEAEDLEAVFGASEAEPVVLFIHDPFCGISRRALGEVEKIGGTVHLVQTGDGKHFGRQIESRTGVPHESPQVLVLRQGRCLWSASHSAIRCERVRSAVESAGVDPPA